MRAQEDLPAEEARSTILRGAAAMERVISRVARRIPWLPVLVILGFLIASSEAAFIGATYTQRGCTSCHEPRVASEANAATPHGAVECLDCHRPPGPFSLVSLNLQAARNMLVAASPWSQPHPSRAIVHDTACKKCHDVVLAQRLTVANDIRMSHAEPAEAGLSCQSCHATALHMRARLTRDMGHSACADCHDGEQAATQCSTCHLREPPRDRAALTGTEAATHGDNRLKAHGMGDMDACTICHARTFCKQCHGVDLPHARVAFPYLHDDEALEVGTEVCVSCHQQSFCTSCHIMEMPHPGSFLAQHPQQVAERGQDVCSRCHVPDDCRTCHQRHVHPGIPADLLQRLRGSPQ